MTWTDQPHSSIRSDGAKVGEFPTGPKGSFEWWSYPPDWKPRGTVDALGPYATRQDAKDALTAQLPYTA